MVVKKQPSEPINTTTDNCNVLVRGIRRTVLKISPHCWKRNEEFRQSQKKKVRDHLEKYLLNERVIKDLVQQISEDGIWFEGVNSDWPAWKYYGHDELIDERNDLSYLIIFFLDDNNPELIGVITVYPCE